MIARSPPALAAFAVALLAIPVSAAGDSGDVPQPPPDAPAAPATPEAAEPAPAGASRGLGPVRPILLVGAGPVAGGITGGVDLGLRVAPLTARFSWRGEFFSGGDYLTFPSGRIGWIFLEGRWLAAHAGVGAGRLTRTFDDPRRGTASAPALVAEGGALLGPSAFLGPLLALQVEALTPVGSRTPRGASLTAPAVSVVLSMNLVALLLPSAFW